MRWAAFFLATALACAETPKPAGTVNHQRPAGTSPASPADWAACLPVPASSHPGCYHPERPSRPDPRFPKTETPRDDSLSKAQINVIVRQHLLAIKCCYETQQQHDPGLAGSVVVGWTIEPPGTVSSSWIVEKTIGSQGVVDCVGESICGWEFPPAVVPTAIGRYPFIFKR